MRIMTLGPKGTFSELACQKYLQNSQKTAEIIFFDTFFDVVTHMEPSDVAILPFENTSDGFIQPTLDLLNHHGLNILETVMVDVSYQFVSKEALDSKRQIYVQFTAVNQVSNFLNNHQLTHHILTESNMHSLKCYEDDPAGQAIIPSHLMTTFKYQKQDIQNYKKNQTRFIVVSKHEYNPFNPTRAALFIEFKEDKSGMLYDLLSIFKDYHLNILAILSRPSKNKIGTYYFFLELEIGIKTKNIPPQVIDTLKKSYNIRVAGIY